MSASVTGVADPLSANAPATRRPLGPPGGGKESSAMANGRSGFGGFGRGEGGALGGNGGAKPGSSGGGLMSPGAGDGRIPGSLGGGFGGVGKRLGRGRTESSDTTGQFSH